jgi:hypothetical protein
MAKVVDSRVKTVLGPYPQKDNSNEMLGTYGIGLDMVNFETEKQEDPKLSTAKEAK